MLPRLLLSLLLALAPVVAAAQSNVTVTPPVTFYGPDFTFSGGAVHLATGNSGVIRQIGGTATTDALLNTDGTVQWNSSASADKNEAVPACTAANPGERHLVVDQRGTAGTFPIVMSPPLGTTISGQSFVDINQNFSAMLISCDGTSNWTVVSTTALSAPTIAGNIALAASPNTAYPLGVWRIGYAVGDQAPPTFFVPQSGSCAFNGWESDGGTCTDAVRGNSWLARINPGGLDSRNFGMASGNTAPNNLTACRAAAAAALKTGLPLTFAGGVLPINPGCDVYSKAHVNFASDTWLQAQADGPVLGTRASSSTVLGLHNGDDIYFERLQVDMNGHHGAALVNRAGMHLEVHNFTMKNPLAGSWTDVLGVTATGTTTNGSTSVTGLSALVGRQGMVVTDLRNCIPAGDQVASTNDGGTSLTLVTATTTGCGADTLTFYPKLPDGGIVQLAVTGANGAYYARIVNPDIRVTADTTVASYTSGNTFDVTSATGIVPMTANTITAASWSGNLLTYTTTSPHGIAAGQMVCVMGMTTAAYNTCSPAARGTLGSTIVLTGVTTNPGAATIGSGKAYYGGSLVADVDVPARLSNATIVTGLSGVTVTVQDVNGLGPQAGFATGANVSFTTGGVGIDFIGTGSGTSQENPNANRVEGGKAMGFQIGQLDYQGNNIVTKSTDYTFSGYGAINGGNGLGTGVASVALNNIFENIYAEYQMLGPAIFFTSDSSYSRGGGCAYNIASWTSAGPFEIVDQGSNDCSASTPFFFSDKGTYTPAFSCGTGAVAGYTGAQSGTYSELMNWMIMTVELQASGAGTCAGVIKITLPALSTNGGHQACAAGDYTSGAALGAYVGDNGVYFLAAPTVTDRIIATCTYSLN